MSTKSQNKCPLCRRNERYETETSLYTCPNRKCKFSHFWFSPAEWSKLCRTVKVRYGTEKAETVWRATKPNGESSIFVNESSARAWAGKNGNVVEATSLDELECAPEADHTEQPIEMVTLRDRYAMAALTGLTAINDYTSLSSITKTAFSLADECMRQRKAQGGE